MSQTSHPEDPSAAQPLGDSNRDAVPQDGDPYYTPWTDPDRDYRPTGIPVNGHGLPGHIERFVLTTLRRVDRFQSRNRVVGFVYAVIKKYNDDEGGRLSAMLAYYTFLGLLPLALTGMVLLDFFLEDQPKLFELLVLSAVPTEFEDAIFSAYESLPSGGLPLWVAIIGLILTGTGGVFAFYAMLNQVFAVPYRFRYGFGPRYLRILLMLLLMGVGVLIVSTGSLLAGLVLSFPLSTRLAVLAVTVLVAHGVLMVAVQTLTRRVLARKEYVLGSFLAALAVTTFVSLGSFIIGRLVDGARPVYGVLAVAVGIISVLYLVSNGIVFSFEISAVRAWQLWPRGIDIHLLTPADQRAYAILTLMDERMPGQRNGILYDATSNEDPRRPDFATLTARQPGIPRVQYDAADPDNPLGRIHQTGSPADGESGD